MPRTQKKPTCGQACKTGMPCKRTVKVAGDPCRTHRDVCPCCYEVPTKGIVKTSCGHAFHWACLAQWAQTQQADVKTCPVCRSKLDEVYQWPKLVRSRMLKWRLDNRKYAESFIQFIDAEVSAIARVLSAAQVIVASILPKENYRELIEKLSIPDCQVDFCKKSMYYEIKVINDVVRLEVQFKNLEEFDMLLEMNMLRYETQILLATM